MLLKLTRAVGRAFGGIFVRVGGSESDAPEVSANADEGVKAKVSANVSVGKYAVKIATPTPTSTPAPTPTPIQTPAPSAVARSIAISLVFVLGGEAQSQTSYSPSRGHAHPAEFENSMRLLQRQAEFSMSAQEIETVRASISREYGGETADSLAREYSVLSGTQSEASSEYEKAAPLVPALAIAAYRGLVAAYKIWSRARVKPIESALRKACTNAYTAYKSAATARQRLGECKEPTNCSVNSSDDIDCLLGSYRKLSQYVELVQFELDGRSKVLDYCAKTGVGRNSRGEKFEVRGHAIKVQDTANLKSNCLSTMSRIKSRIDRIQTRTESSKQFEIRNLKTPSAPLMPRDPTSRGIISR